MKVWRIHIKNEVAVGYTRQDLLDFCQKENLIGVGWGEIKTRINSDSAIRQQAQYYSNVTPAIKALNAMRKMEIDDLIWTRLDSSHYCLCRVTGLWVDSKPTDKHYKLDVPNEKWIDVSSEKWQTHIVEAADELVDKGVSGLFVDNTDVYYVFHEQKIYNALLDIFNAFTEKGIKVIVNGGDVFISEVINNRSIPTCIKAVNQETVFTSINFDDKSFGENNWENREYFIEYLNVCKQNGMDVLLIEYGANDKLREKVMDYCNKNDYVCYFADSLALD